MQETINQGALGIPRYLRCIISISSEDGLEAVLVELTQIAGAWFGSGPCSCYRLGCEESTHITEMQKWSEGQGALLTATHSPTAIGPRLDLMLIGSRGTLYHEE